MRELTNEEIAHNNFEDAMCAKYYTYAYEIFSQTPDLIRHITFEEAIPYYDNFKRYIGEVEAKIFKYKCESVFADNLLMARATGDEEILSKALENIQIIQNKMEE